MIVIRRIRWSVVCLLSVAAGVWACQAPQVASRSGAQGQSDGAFIWRGFNHQWTYNHRLNRMGDYLKQEDCTASGTGELPRVTCSGSVHHTGASGTGADELTFASHYTQIASAAAGFRPARVELHLQGREQREIRREKTVELSVGSDAAEQTHVALLNGYDLHTTRKARAKKPKRFRVWVTDQPSYHPEDGTVSVGVGALIDVNCDSVECKTQKGRVHYRIELRAMLISSGSMEVTSRRFETNYKWNRREEIGINRSALNWNRQGIRGRAKKYPVGLVGFREIDFNLGKRGKYKDHWFVRWENSIRDPRYRQQIGRASFDLNLFFKEWNRKVKRRVTSIARKGDATITSELILVQLPEGRVGYEQATGSLKWRGKNRPSEDPAAEWSRDLRFEF